MQSQKWQNDFCSFPRQTFQYQSNPSLAPTSNTEKADIELFCEDLQDLLELTPKKRCPFHYKGLDCKSNKSRNTWRNRQIWPWCTEWSRIKANRVLIREHTVHSKHPPTTQETILHMDITRWPILKSDWLHSLQPRWRSSIFSAKTRLGADCGSNHELFIAKPTLKLKKVGKTTRPFRYDLKQSPYDYTEEMTNRFKGLDLKEKSVWRTMEEDL